MANIFRAPLVLSRKDPPVQQAVIFVAGSLLLTTLAVTGIPLPLSAAHAMPAQVQHPGHVPYCNADTSQGASKPLLGGGGKPFFVSAHFPPQPPAFKQWLNSDTCESTAKVLIPENRPPVGTDWNWTAPQRLNLRLTLDTSKSQSVTLQAVIPPRPVSNPVHIVPARALWQPPDTSQETAKVLIPESRLPVGTDWNWTAPQRLQLRLTLDTSKSQSVTLQAVIPPPPVSNPVHIAPARALWQPADTSQESAKVLIPEVTLPVGENVQLTPPDRPRPVTDTSEATPVGLFPSVLPIGEQVWIGPHRVPVLPADTTRGSYGTFFPPAPILPLPIGTPLVLPAPQYLWPVTDTTQESPPVAIQGVLPPVEPPYIQPPQGTGGHAKPHRRRHYVEIDGQYFEVRDHEHAVEILTALHEAAKESAPKAVKEAAATAKEVVVPKMAVVKPDRRVPFVKDLQVQVDEANAQLEATYRAAQAEYNAWQMAASKRIADEEDDLHVILIMLGLL